ncbi:MAG: ABC transporter substrate-binding protein [Pseudorhodobacter sp.]|nr:ABC transporter substrate-binding protein [Rhizobacter sp.]
MNLSIRRIVGYIFPGLLLAMAISLAHAQAARSTGLVVAEDVVPQTFDPTQSSQIRTWYAWQLAYEGLVRANADGKIVPVLATKWTVDPTLTTYEFALREGVKFADGSVMVADDVVASFQRLAERGLPYAKDRFKHVEAVTKVNDRTVRFKLKQPDAGFMLNLGSPFVVGSAILSAKWLQSNDPKLAMMGTGPFQMVSYAPNTQLVLKRNDYYWNKDGAAKVTDLTIRYMPEQSAQIAALRSGQIDLMFPSAESRLQLASASGIAIEAVSSTNTVRLNINTNRAPFSNLDFRRAMSLALNRAEIVQGAFLGEGVPSAQVPPSYGWAPKLSELKYQKHDVAQAKALLAKAGYPNGVDITLNHLAGYATYLDRFAEVLKSQMAQVGIRVTIQANQNAVWLDKQNRADYEIMTNEYAYQADPMFYLMPRPGRQGPTPPEMADLIAKAQTGSAEDYAAALRKIAVMQDELVYPDISVAARNAWVAHSAKVATAKPDATLSRTFLANVVLK